MLRGWQTRKPGTLADDATVGTISWTSPSNAGEEDAAVATATAVPITTGLSHYLKATNFGFSIPTDATIAGVVCRVRGAASQATNTWEAKIVKADAISGIAKTGVTMLTSLAYQVFGGDLWGVALTPADVNGSTFGVAVSARNAAASTSNDTIDVIELMVKYLLAEAGRPDHSRFPNPRLRSA